MPKYWQIIRNKTQGNNKLSRRTQDQQESRKDSTGEENYRSENGATTENTFSRIIIETKELIQFRKDNIAYFVANDECPCDEGSRALIEANKIPAEQTLHVGKINETRRSNSKYLFGLCIREGNLESQEIVKKNLRNALTLLRDSLITKNIKEFSIVKSPYIESIPWVDVIELIKVTVTS